MYNTYYVLAKIEGKSRIVKYNYIIQDQCKGVDYIVLLDLYVYRSAIDIDSNQVFCF